MPWLKRGLWMAAWGVWAWLGVGLNRELPRDLGPVVRRVSAHGREYPSGFIDGKSVVAVYEFNPEKDVFSWHTIDALTGERRQNVFDASPVYERPPFSPGARFLELHRPPVDKSATTSVSGVPKSSKAVSKTFERTFADFVTGRVLIVTGQTEGPIYHPTKPWAAFWSGTRKMGEECYATVIDLTTGARLFTWHEESPLENRRRLAGSPFFVGDDRFAVPVDYGSPMSRRIADWKIELWSIPPRPKPADEVLGHGVGFGALAIGEAAQRRGNGGLSPSAKGRIAWHWSRDGKLGFDVFDLGAKHTLLSAAITEAPQPMSRGAWAHYSPPILSRDGDTVLSPILYQLHSLAPPRLIWAASDNELVSALDDGELFEVREEWKIGIGRWVKEFQTFAIRRFRDARLECRSWQRTLADRSTAADGRTFALVRSDVYELPLHVNSRLLALCQAVLALPLILLWRALLWRRKRRQRRLAVATT